MATQKGMESAAAILLPDLVKYAGNAVVSRTLMDHPGGTVTLFAFDEGQKLSEHTTPFDALVQVLDGEVRLVIGGKEIIAGIGETVLMPADVPHALEAVTPFKMLLTMIR